MSKVFGSNRKTNIQNSAKSAVKRFWGNAARLEHANVRNKNKSRKGK